MDDREMRAIAELWAVGFRELNMLPMAGRVVAFAVLTGKDYFSVPDVMTWTNQTKAPVSVILNWMLERRLIAQISPRMGKEPAHYKLSPNIPLIILRRQCAVLFDLQSTVPGTEYHKDSSSLLEYVLRYTP